MTLETAYTPPVQVAAQIHALMGGEIRVLLVEDDPDAAELDKILLKNTDEGAFRVEWCPNLITAMIKLAEPDSWDVVLLDLGLPELNGYKTFRAVQMVAPRPIPVVILTSDETKLTKDLTVGYGSHEREPGRAHPVAYLTKRNLTESELRRALRNAVAFGRADRWHGPFTEQ
jgi:CheY-like chemotaxis protein